MKGDDRKYSNNLTNCVVRSIYFTMPRIARLDTPGLLHHIKIRGIERRKIFNDNKDRDNFIERMSTLLPETKTQCYAWSFLPNHAHFLFRSGPKGIASLMRRLLTGYAMRYNRRHKRHGQLFQNRYKSIVCQEDTYHKSLMGKVKLEWQDVEYVLGYFGKRAGEARKKYRSYVEKGIEMGRRPELVGGGLIRSLGGWDEVKKLKLKGEERIKSDQRILGESDFVSDILSESEDQFARKYRLKSLGYNFKKVLSRVSDLFQLDKEYITGKGRQKGRVMARDLACYWSVNELGMTMVDLARRFDMTPAAVSCGVQRGEKWAKENNYHLET